MNKLIILKIRIAIIALIGLSVMTSGECQIHVGPENNVGVRSEARIDPDSSATIYIQTKSDTNQPYRSNIFSFCKSDTFVGGTSDNLMHNIWNYSWWNMKNNGGADQQAFGIRNIIYNEQMGTADRRYGMEQVVIENAASPSEGGYVVGYSNQGFHRGSADVRGIENVLNFNSSADGPRYGIHNTVVSTHCSPASFNQNQFGIYNILQEDWYNTFGELGCGPNQGQGSAALYSKIDLDACSLCPSGIAGYFDGDIVVTGTPHFTSDSTVKKNIVQMRSTLDIVKQMNPVEFEFRKDLNNSFSGGNHFGLLAQEVDLILPDLVHGTFRLDEPEKITSVDSEGNTEEKLAPQESHKMMTVNYVELVPILIKAIQEQQLQIEALQQQIGGLNSPQKK